MSKNVARKVASWIGRQSLNLSSAAVRSVFTALTWSRDQSIKTGLLVQPAEFQRLSVPRIGNSAAVYASILSQADMREDKTKLREVAKGIELLISQRMQPLHAAMKGIFVPQRHDKTSPHYKIVDYVDQISPLAGYRALQEQEIFECLNGYDSVHGVQIRSSPSNLINAWTSTLTNRKLLLCQNGLIQLFNGCRSLYELQCCAHVIPTSTDRFIFRGALASLSGAGLYTALTYSTNPALWVFLLANGLVATAARLSFARRRLRVLNSVIGQYHSTVLASQQIALAVVLEDTEQQMSALALELWRLIRRSEGAGVSDLQSATGLTGNELLVDECLRILREARVLHLSGDQYSAVPVEQCSLSLFSFNKQDQTTLENSGESLSSLSVGERAAVPVGWK